MGGQQVSCRHLGIRACRAPTITAPSCSYHQRSFCRRFHGCRSRRAPPRYFADRRRGKIFAALAAIAAAWPEVDAEYWYHRGKIRQIHIMRREAATGHAARPAASYADDATRFDQRRHASISPPLRRATSKSAWRTAQASALAIIRPPLPIRAADGDIFVGAEDVASLPSADVMNRPRCHAS